MRRGAKPARGAQVLAAALCWCVASGARHPAWAAEREVTIDAGGWPLPGTLTLPEGGGSWPAVVLVHGTGPHDRDETVLANKPFRDLAAGLASRGIVVLRYEKRSKAHAQRVVASLSDFTPDHETVDDAVAAVALLQRAPEVHAGGVYVLGHSFGGMMAPRIAARAPSVAGLIILGGNTRSLDEMLLDQMSTFARADGRVTVAEQEQINALQQQIALVQDPQLTADAPGVVLGAGARYWLNLRDYRPQDLAATLTIRMLILQGERDYQVTMQDFAGWRRALGGRPAVTLKSYPALNHLFISGVGVSTPAEYARPGTVADEVIGDIAQWIFAGHAR